MNNSSETQYGVQNAQHPQNLDAVFAPGYEDYSECLTPEQAEAKAHLSSLILAHPEYEHAYKTIRKIVRFNLTTQSPEPNCILVLGESGAGKTTLRETIASQMRQPYEVEENGALVKKIPFFDSSVHTDATPSAMSNEILRHMGMGAVTASGAVDRVRACLKRAGTFGFNYDELHNLAGSRSVEAVSKARDWLRDLVTHTGAMVIGYGTPDCVEIFLKEPQLIKRFPVILRLNLFDFDLDPDSTFMTVVRAFENAIGSFGHLLQYNEPRSNHQFLIALYAATGGSINAIKKLYEMALNEAFLDDDRLDWAKFSRAADLLTFDTSITHPENAFELDTEVLRKRIRNVVLQRGAN